MKQIIMTIHTLSPVVLSAMSNATVMTASHSYFSGPIVRGILANRYIQQRELGTHAEEDEAFLSLFFDKLRFVAAYPLAADGTRAFVLPFSMQKSKDGRELLDLMQREGRPGFKSMKGFGVAHGAELAPVNVRKTINLHMSRSDIKAHDGKERLAGRSMAGGIYNYEAVDAGQSFAGVIYGEDEDLQALCDGLGASKWFGYAGRSRFTQYGHCAVSLSDIEDIPQEPVETGNDTICLRLETPFMPDSNIADDAATVLGSVATALNERTQGGFSVELGPQKIVAKSEPVENFVGVWGMKRPRVQSLAAGSVFCLKKDGGWTDADKAALQELLYAGIGSRTEEGFGQLRIWPIVEHTVAKAVAEAPAAKPNAIHPTVCHHAEAIIRKHFIAQVQVWAAEDVQASKGYFPENSTHFFARLDALLGSSEKNAQSHLASAIGYELGNTSTPFAKGLQKVAVRDRKLKWYLTEANLSDMPYNQRDWQSLAEELQLEKAMRVIWGQSKLGNIQSSEALFYAYWHAFFRYGRKAAAGAGKGADVE